VPTWNLLATSYFNVQEDLTLLFDPAAVSLEDLSTGGRRVSLDVSAVPAGTVVTLYFDLIGADADTMSGVSIDNVTLLAGEPPVCDAGGPYEVVCEDGRGMVRLDASASSDPDGDAIEFLWTTDCPNTTIQDATSAQATLIIASSPGTVVSCSVFLTGSDGFAAEQCDEIIFIADRDGVPSNIGWDRWLVERYGDALRIFRVLDLTGVPELLAPLVRAKVREGAKPTGRSILLDWDGALAGPFPPPENATALVIARPDGTVAWVERGPPAEPHLSEAAARIDALLKETQR